MKPVAHSKLLFTGMLYALCSLFILSPFSAYSSPHSDINSPIGVDSFFIPVMGLADNEIQKADSLLQKFQDKLHFEPNKGQFPEQVQFRLNQKGTQINFLKDKVAFSVWTSENDADQDRRQVPNPSQGLQNKLKKPKPDGENAKLQGHTYVLDWPGSNPDATWEIIGAHAGSRQIVRDSEPMISFQSGQELWRRNLYPGIDLRFYTSADGNLEFDYILAPGTNPEQIQMHFDGIVNLFQKADGKLAIITSLGEVCMGKPFVYQAKHTEIQSQYEIDQNKATVRFKLDSAAIKQNERLVIDPVAIVWSSFVGGSISDAVRGMGRDGSGIYVLFESFSHNFPTTPGAFQTTLNGIADFAITKFSPSGQLVWSTYMGGSDFEKALSLEVSENGVYIVGVTSSLDYPVTPGSAQTSNAGGTDYVVSKFNATNGSLIWSSYLGGSLDDAFDLRPVVEVDASGIYLINVTESKNFPVTAGAFQTTAPGPTGNTFVSKLSGTNGSLIWSTYYGTSYVSTFEEDFGSVVFLDGIIDGNNLALTGAGFSQIPATPDALHSTHVGVYGGILTTFNRNTGVPEYSSFIKPTENFYLNGIQADGGNYYLIGNADDSFTTTAGAYQSANAGNEDIIIMAVDKNQKQIQWSTFLGGSNSEENGFDDESNNRYLQLDGGSLYLGGITFSTDFNTTPGAFQEQVSANNCCSYFFIASLQAGDGTMKWATYYTGQDSTSGSSNYDFAISYLASGGVLYFLGSTGSVGIPTSESAVQPDNYGYEDIIAAQFDAGSGHMMCSTYVGGPSNEWSSYFVLEAQDMIFAGYTYDGQYPVTANGFMTMNNEESGILTRLTGCCFPQTNNTISPANISLCVNSTPPQITGTAVTVDINLPSIIRNGVPEPQNQQGNTGPGAYIWQISFDGSAWNTIPGAVEQNYLPQPSTQTRYFRRIIGCDTSNVASYLVGSDIAPQVQPGGPFLICPGDNVTLGSSPTVIAQTPGFTINWNPAGSLNNPAATNPVASPAQTTLYTVTVVDDAGCQVVRNTSVWLLRANAGPDKTICEGDTTQIGAAPLPNITPITYEWTVLSGDVNSIVGSSQIARPKVAPTETTTYQIAVTNANGPCTLYDEVTIVVRNRPVSDAGVSGPICLSTTPVLGPSVPDAQVLYEWYPKQWLSEYFAPNPTYFTWQNQGADSCRRIHFVLEAKDPSGVCASDWDTIYFDVLPEYGGNICDSGYIGHIDQSCGRFEYFTAVEYGDFNSIIGQETLANPFVHPTECTQYRREVTFEGFTCISYINVCPCNPCPYPRLDLNVPMDCVTGVQDIPFCYDIPNPYNYTFTLDTPNPAISLNGNTICLLESINVDRNFQIQYSTPAQGDCIFDITFLYPTLPQSFPTPDINICPENQSQNFIQLGEPVRQGRMYYQWTPVIGLNITAAQNANYNYPTLNWAQLPPGITTYTITKTDSISHCATTFTQVVNIRQPQAEPGNDQIFCGTINMTIGSAGPAYFEYAWSPPEGLSDPSIAQPQLQLFSGAGVTTYSLTVSDPLTGCSDVAEVTFTEYPDLTADAGADVTGCEGQQVTLGGLDLSDQGVVYLWVPAEGLDDPHAANPVATLSQNITYTLYLSVPGSPGCDGFDQVQITVTDGEEVASVENLDITICTPGSYQIGPAEEPDFEYYWSPAAGLNDAGIAQPTATVSASSVYYLTAVNTQDCYFWKDTARITLEQKQNLAGPDKQLCLGDSIQVGLTPLTGYTYTWSPAIDISNTNMANPLVYPTVDQEYILEYESGNCLFRDTVLIAVVPAAMADAGPDQSVCGSSVQIGPSSVDPDYTYQWSPGQGLSDSNVPNPMAAPSAQTDYVLTVTNSFGCSDTDTVQVSPEFDVILPTTAYTICSNSSVILGPSGTYAGLTFSWTPGDFLNDPDIANPIFSGAPSGTHYLNLLIDNGSCTRIFEFSVLVHDAGEINIQDESLLICQNSCAQINPEISGTFTSYFWYPQDGVSSPANPITNICPPQPGNYILTGLNSMTGCVVRDSIYIDQVPIPAPVADAGPDRFLCRGSSSILGTAAVPGVIYDWTPGSYLNNSTLAQPTFTGSATGIHDYVLTTTDETTGCSNSDQIRLSVIDFNFQIGGPSNLCSGDIVNLSAYMDYNPSNLPQSQFDFAWSPGSIIGPDSTSSYFNTVLHTSTTFVLTVTHVPSGCSKMYSYPVVVDPIVRPEIDLPQSVYYCGDQIITYQVPMQALPNHTYQWTSNNPEITISNEHIANPEIVFPAYIGYGSVYLNVINNASSNPSCSQNSHNLNFSQHYINTAPDLTYNICTDDMDGILLGDPNFSDTSSYEYVWTPVSGLDDPLSPSPIANPGASIQYTLAIDQKPWYSGMEFYGCTDYSFHTVNIRPLPVYSAGPDTLICRNAVVRLGSPASPGINFNWTPNYYLSSTSTPQPFANPPQNTTYHVIATTQYGCSVRDTVIVRIANPNIQTQVIMHESCQGSADGSIDVTISGGVGPFSYSWTSSQNPGFAANTEDIINLSPGTYNLIVIDSAGCLTSASFNILAGIVCCDTIVFSWTPGTQVIECGQTPVLELPEVTSHCCNGLNITYSDQTSPGLCGNNYTITRTFTATDNCNNSATYVQYIAVIDQTPPIWQSELPADITGECMGIPVIEPIELVASDDCGDVEVVYTEDTQTGICPGSYIVVRTWTASDECGNSIAHTQHIYIGDNSGPLFVGPVPTDITVSCDNVPDPPTIQVTDECSTASLDFAETISSGTCPNAYQIIRVWTATDACGNSSVHQQNVTVVDDIQPQFEGILPVDITVDCSSVPPASGLTATDNCGNVDMQYSESVNPGICAGNYIINRTWTATDQCGNVSIHTQTIDVQSLSGPQFEGVLPSNITVSCDQIPNPATLNATAACGLEVNIMYDESWTAGACSGSGALVRIWTATDACGNTAQHTQIINVTDNVPPVFNGNLPANLTLDCNEIPAAPVMTASDNCGFANVTFNENIVQQACAHDYILTRTWTATDGCGNTTLHVQTIIVQDNESPVFAGPLPVNQTLECDEVPSAPVLMATDNCGAVSVNFTEQRTNGDCANEYVLTRIWVATDECGNSGSHIQIISVQDNSAPVIEITHPFFEPYASGSTVDIQCFNQTFAWELPDLDPEADILVQDNCSDIITIDHSQSLQEGDCSTGGFMMRIIHTWTATDECGNVGIYSINIDVIDTIPPVITGVPDDISVNCADVPNLLPMLPCGSTGQIPSDIVMATDECECSNLYMIEEIIEGACSREYILLRIWEAEDNCGNVARDTQRIFVSDTSRIQLSLSNPYLENIPSGESIFIDCQYGFPSWVYQIGHDDLKATMACSNQSVEIEFERNFAGYGDCRAGEYLQRYELIWTATDDCGETEQYIVYVDLQDTTAPVITNWLDLSCDPIFNENQWHVEENCQGLEFSYLDQHVEGVCYPGSKDVHRTVTITDYCGNISSYEQMIVGEDSYPQFIWAQDIHTQLHSGDTSTIECTDRKSGSLSGFSETDMWLQSPCNIGLETQFEEEIMEESNCAEGYLQIVRASWSATTACGQSSSFTIYVKVVDTQGPLVEMDAVVHIQCGQAIPDPIITDQCGSISWSFSELSRESRDCPEFMMIVREIVAIDACGNETKTEQELIIHNTGVPVMEGMESVICLDTEDDSNLQPPRFTDLCTGEELSAEMSIAPLSPECTDMSQGYKRVFRVLSSCGIWHSFEQMIVMNQTSPIQLEVWDAEFGDLYDGQTFYRECGVDEEIIPEEIIVNRHCAGGYSVEQSSEYIISGDCNEMGYYASAVYTVLATDICGKSGSMSYTIIWVDTQAPEFTVMPGDTILYCMTPEMSVAFAEDACSDIEMDYNERTYYHNDRQTIQRIWTATDACGNMNSHLQNIEIRDREPFNCDILLVDSLICNGNGIQVDANITGGQPGFEYFWEIEGGSCSIDQGQGSSSILISVGFTRVTITLTVVDANGCVTECQIEVLCTMGGVETNGLLLEDVVLYPNPAHNELYIDGKVKADGEFLVLILDPYGREIHREERIMERHGRYSLVKDVRNVNSNMLIVRFIHESGLMEEYKVMKF